jgi:hypothetical protein
VAGNAGCLGIRTDKIFEDDPINNTGFDPWSTNAIDNISELRALTGQLVETAQLNSSQTSL